MPTHIPVLHTEVLTLLHPEPGDAVLDVTLGLGGHAEALLKATAPDGRLTGLDADRKNLEAALTRLRLFGSRVTGKHLNFRDVHLLAPEQFDILLADLGLSSPHLDDPERGFSFRSIAPLDMRFDQSTGESAAELLLSASEETLATMLRDLGEIPRSRALAQALHSHFHSEPKHLNEWTTDDVRQCAEKVFGYRAPSMLPQVFQALRIAVNDELGALQSLLHALPKLLKPGGRAGIISFHSLEDRLVKQEFKRLSTPDYDPTTGAVAVPSEWELVTKKPVSPTAEEIGKNPRARSARLRVLRRVPQAATSALHK